MLYVTQNNQFRICSFSNIQFYNSIIILKLRVSQKTWEFSDEFDIVFVMN